MVPRRGKGGERDTIMTALNAELIHDRLLGFLKAHVEKTTDECSKGSEFTWNMWKQQVEPLVEISDVLGVDCEELRRAKESYHNAQVYLIHTKQAQIIKLKQAVIAITPPGGEDLT